MSKRPYVIRTDSALCGCGAACVRKVVLWQVYTFERVPLRKHSRFSVAVDIRANLCVFTKI